MHIVSAGMLRVVIEAIVHNYPHGELPIYYIHCYYWTGRSYPLAGVDAGRGT